jgi:hypothetical protein
MRGVEPSVANEREEEQSSLAKLERLVVLGHVIDIANERGLGGVEALESFDGDWTRCVGKCMQRVLNWLVLVLIASSSPSRSDDRGKRGRLGVPRPTARTCPPCRLRSELDELLSQEVMEGSEVEGGWWRVTHRLCWEIC